MNITQVKPHKQYKIKSVHMRDFAYLGICEEETISLLKVSPLKQTFLIGVRNTTIAIKRQVAENIILYDI